MNRSLPVVAFALLLPAAAMAQRVGPYRPHQDPAASRAEAAALARAAAEAPHIAERYGVAPLAELGDATVEAPARLEALRVWNETHHLPLHNGFARPLPAPRQVELDSGLLAASAVAEHAGGLAVQTALDKVAWGGKVRVANAWGLRLHLARVSLPAGTRLWVHGAGYTAGPFGRELIDGAGGLWTPIVRGDEAALDVELPAAALAGNARFGFRVDQVMELVDVGTVDTAVGKAALACNLDASCFGTSDFPAIDDVRHAVAAIYFVDSGEGGQCTGELLNDTHNSGIPYLLTANHCISTASGATSLEAFWDYYTPSCNGPAPSMGSLPRTNGATLLATAAAGNGGGASDYTLLRLLSAPPGQRVFLGWNAEASATVDGTLLYRLSHPLGLPQNFVVTKADSTTPTCTGVPPPNFLYSDQVTGGSFGGSSGSAALLANGEVVGQLYGGCGSDNDCSPQQFTVDGAFDQSFPALQSFLAPNGSVGSCFPDQLTLCLLQNRFRVKVSWTNQFNGTSGDGVVIPSTDSTGFFYFTDPSNYELVVKILDFGTVVKVFYTELTDLHFTITVTDTVGGTIKTYGNTPGDCGAIDESAFPGAAQTGAKARDLGSAAAGGATEKRGSCAPSSTTLCLLNQRFAVHVSWFNQFNGASGQGSPRTLSDQSGLFIFTDPTVIELVLKMVDFGDRTALFYGALSDYQYDLTVFDTIGGSTKTYHNPAGTYCGGLDNTAFPP